jgi:hypothetical protein
MHTHRSRSALIFMVVAVASGAINAQSAAKIEDAGWLVGCWSITRADGFTEEHWLAPAGGAMLGVGRSIRASKMIEFEFLSIREVNGQLAYVAIPSRQKETVFPLVKSSAAELVFENPTHDFPQRVIYRKVPDGIAARVEGMLNGKLRSEDYAYQRCK